MKKTILKVPVLNFIIYVILLIISILLILIGAQICNTTCASIFISIGTGEFASVVLAYLIDMANNLRHDNEVKYLRRKETENIRYLFEDLLKKLVLFLAKSAILFYKTNLKDEIYKISYKDIWQQLESFEEKYGKEYSTYSYQERPSGYQYLEIIRGKCDYLKDLMNNFNSQEKAFRLDKCFTTEEIDNFKNVGISLILLPNDNDSFFECLEGVFNFLIEISEFKYLADKTFYYYNGKVLDDNEIKQVGNMSSKIACAKDLIIQ